MREGLVKWEAWKIQVGRLNTLVFKKKKVMDERFKTENIVHKSLDISKCDFYN